MRHDWDTHALVLAWSASLRSEDPYLKVGACALGSHNEVLGVAYNGLVSGTDVQDNFWDNRDARLPFMIHAEVNLFAHICGMKAKTVAITHQPCSSCAQLIAANHVKRVVYTDEYERDPTGLKILDFYGIEVRRIPKLALGLIFDKLNYNVTHEDL